MRTYTVRERAAARARTPDWWSTSWCTPTTARSDQARAGRRGAEVGDRAGPAGAPPRPAVRRHRVRPGYGAPAAARRRRDRRAGHLRDPGQLPPTASGAAFLEVPTAADVQTVAAPGGCDVVWLPARRWRRTARGCTRRCSTTSVPARTRLDPMGEVDPDLWETPTYSSSGEDVESAATVVGHDLDDVYAWIAGESGWSPACVGLVKDLGWTAARSPSWATGDAASPCADASCRCGRRPGAAAGEQVPAAMRHPGAGARSARRSCD